MPLYRCQTCGCVENSALGFYWSRDHTMWPAPYRGKELCSQHGPPEDIYHNPTPWGKWHGQFAQRSASGMLIDQHGHLWTPEQVENHLLPLAYYIVGEVP